MRPAFPASDYYGPSVPPRRHQPTASLPTTARGRWPGRRRDGSHVHHASIDGVGDQLSPLQHRHKYAADLPRGLTTSCIKPASEFPPAAITDGTRCAPAHIHQVGAGVTLEGVRPLIHLRFAFPSRSASTGPSDGAGPPRLHRGCSHPHPRFRDQAAASFTRPLRRPSGEGLAPSLDFVAPRGAQCRRDAHAVAPCKPLTFKQPAACQGIGGGRVANQSATSEDYFSAGKSRSNAESRAHLDHINAATPPYVHY